MSCLPRHSISRRRQSSRARRIRHGMSAGLFRLTCSRLEIIRHGPQFRRPAGGKFLHDGIVRVGSTGFDDVGYGRLAAECRHPDTAGIHDQNVTHGDNAWYMRVSAKDDARLPNTSKSWKNCLLGVHHGPAGTDVFEQVLQVTTRWASMAGKNLSAG